MPVSRLIEHHLFEPRLAASSPKDRLIVMSNGVGARMDRSFGEFAQNTADATGIAVLGAERPLSGDAARLSRLARQYMTYNALGVYAHMAGRLWEIPVLANAKEVVFAGHSGGANAAAMMAHACLISPDLKELREKLKAVIMTDSPGVDPQQSGIAEFEYLVYTAFRDPEALHRLQEKCHAVIDGLLGGSTVLRGDRNRSEQREMSRPRLSRIVKLLGEIATYSGHWCSTDTLEAMRAIAGDPDIMLHVRAPRCTFTAPEKAWRAIANELLQIRAQCDSDWFADAKVIIGEEDYHSSYNEAFAQIVAGALRRVFTLTHTQVLATP